MPIPALGRKFCLNSINRFISSLTENDYCSAWDLVLIVTFALFCPKRPTGTFDIFARVRLIKIMLIRLVVLNSFATVEQTFFFFLYPRVTRASCRYYCKFTRDHRRPEAYQSLREKAVSLCFRSYFFLSLNVVNNCLFCSIFSQTRCCE